MELKDSILKTIAFFDLFDFPLTAEEIRGRLYKYGKPIHIKEIKGVLGQMAESGIVELIKDNFVLKGRGQLVETRKTHKFISEKLWARTKLYGQYMRSVPFVRMVAVCNNLAYDNADEKSDIDIFIVIEVKRMWTARLILTLILQFFGVRRHGNKIAGRFCLSFFVTNKMIDMEPLQIKPEDPYLAYWTQTLSPIYGRDMYDRFKKENEVWLEKIYQLKFPETATRHHFVSQKSKWKNFFEWLLRGWFGNMIESLLKKTFKKKTLTRAKHMCPEASVIVTDDMLKFHNHDRRKEYLEKWKKII